jgi:hypothetical protein
VLNCKKDSEMGVHGYFGSRTSIPNHGIKTM